MLVMTLSVGPSRCSLVMSRAFVSDSLGPASLSVRRVPATLAEGRGSAPRSRAPAEAALEYREDRGLRAHSPPRVVAVVGAGLGGVREAAEFVATSVLSLSLL